MVSGNRLFPHHIFNLNRNNLGLIATNKRLQESGYVSVSVLATRHTHNNHIPEGQQGKDHIVVICVVAPRRMVRVPTFLQGSIFRTNVTAHP
jgi:hypothetical protein